MVQQRHGHCRCDQRKSFPHRCTGIFLGNYSVTGTNLVGAVSANITLTVSQPAPAITTQPANATVSVGDTAQFSVVAAGLPTPTYQWQVLPSGTST